MKIWKRYLSINLVLLLILTLLSGTVLAADDIPLDMLQTFTPEGYEEYRFSYVERDVWRESKLKIFRLNTTFGNLKVFDAQGNELATAKHKGIYSRITSDYMEVVLPTEMNKEYRIVYQSEPLAEWGGEIKIAATAANCTVLSEGTEAKTKLFYWDGFAGDKGLFFKFVPTVTGVYFFSAGTASQIEYFNADMKKLGAEEIRANGKVKMQLEKGQTYYISLYRDEDNGIEVINTKIELHQHSYSETIVPAACEEQGYTERTCYCGYTYRENLTDALGHNWDNGVISIKPTVNTNGEMTYYCRRCGAKKNVSIPPVRNNPFTDVKAGAYYYDAVLWAAANNVTAGTSATAFSPEVGCTRAQVVTFLWRAAGQPKPTTGSNPFGDVKNGTYYYEAVLWAVEKGITTGTSTTTFSPDDTCTRAQIVMFLWRYEGQPAPTTANNPFADVKESAYFAKAVLWAAESGVTSGTSATTFSPKDTCTRAQVVTFLYRDITNK